MTIRDFIAESNRIEGIHREPTAAEIGATREFLKLPKPTVEDVAAMVKAYQPDAVLRDKPGLNVRVGRYLPPPGAPEIRTRLEGILDRLDSRSPWEAHLSYESLHPFTDGNGRSGRAIWLWQMNGEAPLGFLHHFYYQTLSEARR